MSDAMSTRAPQLPGGGSGLLSLQCAVPARRPQSILRREEGVPATGTLAEDQFSPVHLGRGLLMTRSVFRAAFVPKNVSVTY